jgi:hypothetical protein
VGPTTGAWGDACVGAIPPTTEQCNLLDDDCDGSTDEDFDLLNDDGNCGQCNHTCGAGLRCYNGQCLPDCPSGFYPATTASQPVCISALQDAATPCEAFASCATLTDGGKVGYGGDGWTLSNPLPPGLEELEEPIIVWTEITGDVGNLSARYVCLDTAHAPDGGGTKNCPDCNTSCDSCAPENCPASLTECGKCGCALRYWCHLVK